MNKELEEKKVYFNRYKEANEKYNSLKKQEKFLRMRLYGTKAIVYSDTPRGGRKTDLSDEMVRLEMILERIEAAKKDMLNACADIESVIVNIPDEIESSIIHMRYIELLSWEEIADQLGYSRSQVSRIHNKALESLKIA